jgi:hypothetical protein
MPPFRVQTLAGGAALVGALACPDLAAAHGVAAVGTGVGIVSMLLEAAGAVPCHGFRAGDVAVLGFVALLLVAAMRFRHMLARRRLDLARQMVERGLEPPRDLLDAPHRDDLRRGIVLLFLAAGIAVASAFSHEGRVSPFGLVPGFVGLGYLLSHFLAARRSRP